VITMGYIRVLAWNEIVDLFSERAQLQRGYKLCHN